VRVHTLISLGACNDIISIYLSIYPSFYHTVETLVRYGTLWHRKAIVRVLWRTIAQHPSTVGLCLSLSCIVQCFTSVFARSQGSVSRYNICCYHIGSLCYAPFPVRYVRMWRTPGPSCDVLLCKLSLLSCYGGDA
jgi:hypothetical protein